MDVSAKNAREVCNTINGMLLNDAKQFLENVQLKKAAVPFRRYKRKGAHRSELEDFHTGAYPRGAAESVLAVLSNLEANAEFKGLDMERLRIIHAATHRGRVNKSYTPRAQGRSTPAFNTLVHIELVATES